jgi:saccharopine dehydrogenase-like NADP-dependent oxidoreductase
LKTILLIGAGKSATVLIDYLLATVEKNKWKFVIADADAEQILAKTNNSPFAKAVQLDVTNDKQRGKLIESAHVVISMIPPTLHFLVAKDCVEYRKHLLTASYLDAKIKSLQDEINNRKLFFLSEMGLDPGIDHMSAMKIIDNIQQKGGTITSFKSHCGGLIAPESDNNPWHYKISWNPKNIIMAGQAGAVYKIDGKHFEEKYTALFDASRSVFVNNTIGALSYYPNRDSLSYVDTYKLQSATTFMRTTLRHTDFMSGWSNIVALGLTDELKKVETNGLCLKDFFENYFKNFSAQNDTLLQKIVQPILDFYSGKMDDNNLFIKQMLCLGLDNTVPINKGTMSIADVLQLAVEKALALQQADKDMIVMLHEFEYELNGEHKKVTSTLVVKGQDNLRTAMAKTVGLPLGITATLILEDVLKIKGLHIPTSKAIYEPVLAALEKYGIQFEEVYS